jgi:hypothetical protein
MSTALRFCAAIKRCFLFTHYMHRTHRCCNRTTLEHNRMRIVRMRLTKTNDRHWILFAFSREIRAIIGVLVVSDIPGLLSRHSRNGRSCPIRVPNEGFHIRMPIVAICLGFGYYCREIRGPRNLPRQFCMSGPDGACCVGKLSAQKLDPNQG